MKIPYNRRFRVTKPHTGCVWNRFLSEVHQIHFHDSVSFQDWAYLSRLFIIET